MNSELEDEGCREAVQRLQARFAESSHGLRPAVIDSTGIFFWAHPRCIEPLLAIERAERLEARSLVAIGDRSRTSSTALVALICGQSFRDERGGSG